MTMQRTRTRRLQLWAGNRNATHKTNRTTTGKTGQGLDEVPQDGFVTDDQGEVKHGKGRQQKQPGPLAKEIEGRRQAAERMYAAAESYWSAESKKRALPFELTANLALEAAMTFDHASTNCADVYGDPAGIVEQAAREGGSVVARSKDVLLPIEALALAMAASANTYALQRSNGAGDTNELHLKNSKTYASHLGYVAAVNLALGELHTAFTDAISSTMLSRLARFQAAIESLRLSEKKAETARERVEAAERKRDKVRVKGESKREIEEEARVAAAMYDEAKAELENRIAIFTATEQDGFGSISSILKDFLDVHIEHFSSQLDVLTRARQGLESQGDATTLVESAPRKATVRPTMKRRSETISVISERRASFKANNSATTTLTKTLVRSSTANDMNKGIQSGASKSAPTSDSVPTHSPALDDPQAQQEVKKCGRRRGSSVASKLGSRFSAVLTRRNSMKGTTGKAPGEAAAMQQEGHSTEDSSRTSWTGGRIANMRRNAGERGYHEVEGVFADQPWSEKNHLAEDKSGQQPRASSPDKPLVPFNCVVMREQESDEDSLLSKERSPNRHFGLPIQHRRDSLVRGPGQLLARQAAAAAKAGSRDSYNGMRWMRESNGSSDSGNPFSDESCESGRGSPAFASDHRSKAYASLLPQQY